MCKVVLCQHPAPNFSQGCECRNESLRAEENVFDPHNCPPGIKGEMEQVYVHKIEKAAKLTMVKNIFTCPCLVVDGICVPNSYVKLLVLYVVFLSNRYVEQ